MKKGPGRRDQEGNKREKRPGRRNQEEGEMNEGPGRRDPVGGIRKEVKGRRDQEEGTRKKELGIRDQEEGTREETSPPPTLHQRKKAIYDWFYVVCYKYTQHGVRNIPTQKRKPGNHSNPI